MPVINTPNYRGYKTRQQVSSEYDISTKTLLGKLKEEGIRLPPGRIGLKDLKRIYKALGYPPCVSKKDYIDV